MWFKAGNFGGVVYQPPHIMRTVGLIPAGACTPVTPATRRPGRYQEGEMPAPSTAVTAGSRPLTAGKDQHPTETVFRGRGLFYSVTKEPEIKPFQLWYPVIGGLPLRLWVQLPPPQHDAPCRRHCSESKRRYPAEIAVCRSLLRLFAGWCQPHFFHISGGVLFWVPLIPLHSIKPRRGAPPGV